MKKLLVRSMTKLTFFQQKRRDEAVRTGVEVDEELVLQRFTPGNPENNSALVWYVDVRCVSEASLPADSSAAREFFQDIAEPVRRTLLSTADELRAGLDAEIWPLRKQIDGLPPGIKGELATSAMRLVAGRELAEVLQTLARNWPDNLRELSEAQPVYHAEASL